MNVTVDELMALFEAEAKRRPLADRIKQTTGFERVKALREFYKLAETDILDAGERQWGMDPYEVDWLSIFTPIEYALWYDIRGKGLVAYPQYPVGRYIVDFANPCARIAIECDGAAWHKDLEADQRRENEILCMGWSVYRITGKDCLTISDPETGKRSAASDFIDRILLGHGLK